MSNLIYKKQVLIKSSYSIFPYNRIDLKNTSFNFSLSTKDIFNEIKQGYNRYITSYTPDAIKYTLAPTTSGAPVAKTLPSSFPFKTSKFDISQGIPNLKRKAKRSKIPITSYNFSTRTYTLSNVNIDFNYLYNSLKTRVYKKDLFEEIVIQNVNQGQKKVTATTENWGNDIVNTDPEDFYILTENAEFTDSSAGTWKLFPYFNTSLTADIEYLQEYALNVALNTDSFPSNDTSFSLNNNYSLPFNLYVHSQRFADRYFLPTGPQNRKAGQGNPDGRWVTSRHAAFIELASVIAVPVSSAFIDINNTTVTNNLPDKEVYNKVLINSNSTVSQLVSTSPETPLLEFVPYIQINSFYQTPGQNPSNFNLTNVSLLSATATGLQQVNPFNDINYNSKWGSTFGLSDDNLLVGAPGINAIHTYSLSYNPNSPYNVTVSPLSVIVPPTAVVKNTINVVSLTGFGDNLTVDSRDKRKKSIDFYATSFGASLQGLDNQNVIEVGSISNNKSTNNSTIHKSFHIIDSNVPHLSSNSIGVNEISKLYLIIDNSKNTDNVLVVAAQRPNVPYQGKVGVIDLYGCSDSTSPKLLAVLNSNNSSLSSASNVNFGTSITGELGTLCVGVSSDSGSQIEVYSFKPNVVTTTIQDNSALSGVRSFYSLDFSINKVSTVINFENSNDTSFGKVIYYDQALRYDPFYENQPLYVNRLFVGSNDKLFVFEDFNNVYLPSKVLNIKTRSLGAYYNNIVSLSTSSNKSVNFYTISAFEV